MIKRIFSETYGNITYEESNFSGKRSIYINGKQMHKVDKTTYEIKIEDNLVKVYIEGNSLKGAKLIVDKESYELFPKTIWYEYILTFLPFILILVWGNSVELCSIVPVIGGAIGGAISGVLSYVSLTVMRKYTNPLIKILVGLGFVLLTFALCALLGYAFLASLAQ